MKKDDRCELGKYCSSLKKYGQVYSGKLTKGILLEEFFDTNELSKELKYIGTVVRYSKGHQEKGIRFNFCPFCGVNFNIIYGYIYRSVKEGI